MERPALRALADRVGILPDYVDTSGQICVTSDVTRARLLFAMGFGADTEEEASRSLDAIERRNGEALVPPVSVRREPLAPSVAARLPAELSDGELEWTVELTLESGETYRSAGAHSGARRPAFEVPLPVLPPPGYHRVRVALCAGGEERSAEQTLIVTPPTCLTPEEKLGGRSVFGLCANLYSLRSESNWGVGDLGDLRWLLSWGGGVRAGFVGVNPLHALRNKNGQISPYSPVSRLFRNVLYIDVTAVPEMADCAEARRWMRSPAVRDELARLRASDHVDYEAVMALKRPALEYLHRTFLKRHTRRSTARGRAYAAYRKQQGETLVDFATFLALEEHFADAPNWQAWPAPYRDRRSAEVVKFRRAHGAEVDFHCYLQFELDRQLAAIADEARKAEMQIGMYQDLAIGSARDSADTWVFPDLFVEGVSIGAPPDAYATNGQDWGLPPLDPVQLAADGYRYWVHLVRSGFAHAGALRIDHVMGLFRQFWIPLGHPASEGAYVRFPSEEMLGILALESRRASALVVGEDLGTVPPGLPQMLQSWGLLSSRVLYFEQDERGFRPSAEYPARALVTANTHDLATLAAFWQGRDIELRRAMGLIETDEACVAAYAHRERERAALLERLSVEGVLPAPVSPSSTAELCAAVHGFLCRTPSALAGLSLDDLVGETEPVNLPGVGLDRYPSWSRKLHLTLESVAQSPEVKTALSGARARVC